MKADNETIRKASRQAGKHGDLEASMPAVRQTDRKINRQASR